MPKRREPLPPPLPPEDLPELAQTLVRRQECLEYTDGQMAAFLGVSIEDWRQTRAGRVSMSVLSGVTQAFPQLQWLVVRFLQGLETGGPDAVTLHERANAAREAWEAEQQ